LPIVLDVHFSPLSLSLTFNFGLIFLSVALFRLRR
jgi:hypothetical protein